MAIQENLKQGKTMMKKIILALCAVVVLAGCETDAMVGSRNLSKAADNFEVLRRVVFYNGITGEYMLVIEGYCSLAPGSSARSISVTCKERPGELKKHLLGLSDNVTYFAEQMDNVNVSLYHHRVIFKPQTILPDIDFRGSTTDLPRSN